MFPFPLVTITCKISRKIKIIIADLRANNFGARGDEAMEKKGLALWLLKSVVVQKKKKPRRFVLF